MIAVLIIIIVLLALALQLFLLKRGARGISAELDTDKTGAEPDEVFTIHLRIRNDSYLIRPFVGFEITLPKDINIVSQEEIISSPPYSIRIKGSVFLWPKGKAERSFKASIGKRGNYRFGSITIKTGDFLGIREDISETISVQSVSIYPKRTEGTDIRKVTGGIMGDLPVRRFIFEDPVLFSGFREYTGREPMKDISWLQSARTGKLMVRQYDHTSHVTATVLLDTYGAEPQLAETCFSLARDVCMQLDEKGIEYGLYMNADLGGSAVGGHYIARGMGNRHLYGIFMQLANALYTCRYTDEQLIKGFARNVRQTTGIVYITCGDEGRKSVLIRNLPPELRENICFIPASEYMEPLETEEDKKWA